VARVGELIGEKENEKMKERKFVWNIGLLLLTLLSLFFSAISMEANTSQLYMFIYDGKAGLDFYCSESPTHLIDESLRMSGTEYTPFALHPNDLVLKAHVVEVTYCNLDNIYEGDGTLDFVWRFTERITDGHLDHQHFTRGAYWTRLLSFSDLGD
jgi:hypothetical protein